MEKNKITMVTFGNKRFTNAKKKIKKEAEDINIFDKIVIEEENIIQESPFSKIIKNLPNGRGYYWYMWKPYIIYKQLLEINKNEFLFYCDSGMTILNNKGTKSKFKMLFELVSDNEKCPSSIVSFITTGPTLQRYEYMYNMKQLFSHFNVLDNKEITHTQQIQAGIVIIKKTEKSLDIIKKWLDTAINFPELFIGDYRFAKNLEKVKQFDGFRDHRHDQSVWSVLCKIHNVTIVKHDKNPIYQTHYRS